MELVLLSLSMVFLLFLKGFFSGSEIALVNADKLKLHHKANQGDKRARLILEMFHSPEVILGTTLVGTNVSTIAFVTIGTMILVRTIGDWGDVYAFLIFTPLLLILGEIVPKSVYQQKSDSIALFVIHPLRFFSRLFYPVIFVFSRVGRHTARLAGGGKTGQNVFITREQIRSLVEMAERGSNVDAFDRGRIGRVIKFADTTVGEAMIPVAEITAINRTRNTRDALLLVRRYGYNRLPVYERNITNIVGIVTLSTWDLMDPELRERSLAELIKPALYVSPYQTIDQLLPELREREDHMAIVVDEFGSAIGMITMEDILEEVVGEIDVGYDFDEYLPRRKHIFQALNEDSYLMDSRLPISEVNEVLGVDLAAKESHTIGGLVMARLRHIPKKGESIVESGYRFTVAEATDRTVVKLRVEPI